MRKVSNVFDRALSKEQVESLADLADRIDGEEAEEIKALGRRLQAEDETISRVVGALKAARLRKGLTLAEVDERTGIGRSNLFRLENHADATSTLETLLRYADAVGVDLLVTVAERDARTKNSDAA